MVRGKIALRHFFIVSADFLHPKFDKQGKPMKKQAKLHTFELSADPKKLKKVKLDVPLMEESSRPQEGMNSIIVTRKNLTGLSFSTFKVEELIHRIKQSGVDEALSISLIDTVMLTHTFMTPAHARFNTSNQSDIDEIYEGLNILTLETYAQFCFQLTKYPDRGISLNMYQLEGHDEEDKNMLIERWVEPCFPIPKLLENHSSEGSDMWLGRKTVFLKALLKAVHYLERLDSQNHITTSDILMLATNLEALTALTYNKDKSKKTIPAEFDDLKACLQSLPSFNPYTKKPSHKSVEALGYIMMGLEQELRGQTNFNNSTTTFKTIGRNIKNENRLIPIRSKKLYNRLPSDEIIKLSGNISPKHIQEMEQAILTQICMELP